MSKNYCDIHQKHFGKGFAGRGRRRCYECERTTMGEAPFDFLMNRLDGNGAVVTIHQSDHDGMSGVLFVQMDDGTKFSIHFDKA